MPKEPSLYQTTNYYSKQITRILITRLKIVVPYKYYKKEGLKYVSKLIIRFYTYYIYVRVQCSLIFLNTKRKEINNAQKVKRLQLLCARAKAS